MTNLPSRADCRGDNSSGQDWFYLWNNPVNACYNTYFNYIYASSGSGPPSCNKGHLKNAQSDFVKIIDKYLGQGNKITIPGVDEYNPFQESILFACRNLPGTCDIALQAFCKGVGTTPKCENCSGPYGCGSTCSTRDGIASNIGILNFCGCYAPLPDVPQARSVITQNPQCDPLCTRQETIHLNDNNCNVLQCKNDVCVIDDITIKASGNSTGGSVNFDQICQNCQGDTICTCIISGIDISKIGDSVQGFQTQFNQYCGDNSLCLQIVGDVDEPVNCENSLKSQDNDDTSFNIQWWLIIFVIIILILLFIIIGAINYGRRSNKSIIPGDDTGLNAKNI